MLPPRCSRRAAARRTTARQLNPNRIDRDRVQRRRRRGRVGGQGGGRRGQLIDRAQRVREHERPVLQRALEPDARARVDPDVGRYAHGQLARARSRAPSAGSSCRRAGPRAWTTSRPLRCTSSGPVPGFARRATEERAARVSQPRPRAKIASSSATSLPVGALDASSRRDSRLSCRPSLGDRHTADHERAAEQQPERDAARPGRPRRWPRPAAGRSRGTTSRATARAPAARCSRSRSRRAWHRGRERPARSSCPRRVRRSGRSHRVFSNGRNSSEPTRPPAAVSAGRS